MKHYIKIVLRAINNHSLCDIVREKIIHKIIKNPSTRNRVLWDARLNDLNKKYAIKLDGMVNKNRVYTPVKPPNTIWVFWRQGFENAPRMVKACVNSLMKHLTKFNIVLLTGENLQNYICLPSYIEKKHEQGIIKEALYSDIVRVSLLAEYGGIWIDATTLCTDGAFAEKFTEWPLFFYKAIDIDRESEPAICASNWIISAWAHHPFIMTLRDFLYEYWKEETYLIDYYLFHLILHLIKDRYPEEWKSIPAFSEVNPHILQFEQLDQYSEERFREIKRMSDFHKMSWHGEEEIMNDPRFSGSFYEKIVKKRMEE